MPVLVSKIQKLIRDERERLTREQITPWTMGFAIGRLNIEDFNKRKISYGGGTFSGSPRDVFWGRYIEPFLEDFTNRTIGQISSECENNRLNLEVELDCLSSHLKSLYAGIFNEMANADQRMHGKGYPNNVIKKDVTPNILNMNSYLSSHLKMEIDKHNARKGVQQPQTSSPVSSHGQQGGITAHILNVHGGIHTNQGEKLNAWTEFWRSVMGKVIAAVITAFIFAGLAYLGLHIDEHREPSISTSDHGSTVTPNLTITQNANQIQNAGGNINNYYSPQKPLRQIDTQQTDIIKKSVAQFIGQKFCGLMPISSSDAQPLWVAFEKTLRSAGWISMPPPGLAVGEPPTGVNFISRPGIFVEIEPNAPSAVVDAAKALAQAIHTVMPGPIEVNAIKPQFEPRPDVITLEIGLAPP